MSTAPRSSTVFSMDEAVGAAPVLAQCLRGGIIGIPVGLDPDLAVLDLEFDAEPGAASREVEPGCGSGGGIRGLHDRLIIRWVQALRDGRLGRCAPNDRCQSGV